MLGADALAFGIWAGRRWAWILGIVVAVTGMLVGVYTLPPGVAGIVIDGIVLALLLPSVREYCG